MLYQFVCTPAAQAAALVGFVIIKLQVGRVSALVFGMEPVGRCGCFPLYTAQNFNARQINFFKTLLKYPIIFSTYDIAHSLIGFVDGNKTVLRLLLNVIVTVGALYVAFLLITFGVISVFKANAANIVKVLALIGSDFFHTSFLLLKAYFIR